MKCPVCDRGEYSINIRIPIERQVTAQERIDIRNKFDAAVVKLAHSMQLEAVSKIIKIKV